MSWVLLPSPSPSPSPSSSRRSRTPGVNAKCCVCICIGRRAGWQRMDGWVVAPTRFFPLFVFMFSFCSFCMYLYSWRGGVPTLFVFIFYFFPSPPTFALPPHHEERLVDILRRHVRHGGEVGGHCIPFHRRRVRSHSTSKGGEGARWWSVWCAVDVLVPSVFVPYDTVGEREMVFFSCFLFF